MLVKEHFEVVFSLESILAVVVWAPDWEFAHLDLSSSVLSKAFSVVEVLAGGDAVDGSLFVVFIKEWHQADLARSVSQDVFHLSDVLALHLRDWGCRSRRRDDLCGNFLLLIFHLLNLG